MSKSKNIGLHLTPVSEKEKSFLDFRSELAGEGCNSNMEIIDAEIGKMQGENESHAKTTTAPNNDTPAANDGVHGIKYTKDKKLKIKNHFDTWDTVITPYKTFTAIIDESEVDPDSMVSYADDAVELTAQSNEWLKTEIFKDIRPCVFRDGKVQCYLDPNDFTSQIKNKEPMFYEDNDFIISAGSAYTDVCKVTERGQLIDKDGNSIGYIIDGATAPGFVIQNDGDNTVIYYGADGFIEYRYAVPTNGDYYLIMRFKPATSEQVMVQDITVNDESKKTVEFPRFNWETSRSEFQIMRYAVSLRAGYNTIRISTPAEALTGNASVVGIQSIGFKSIDPVDTYTNFPRSQLSAFALKDSVTTTDYVYYDLLTPLTVLNNHQVLQYRAVGNPEDCRIEVHLNDSVSKIHELPIQAYPIMQLDFNTVLKNSSTPRISIEAMLPYTKTEILDDGTKTTSTAWYRTWDLPYYGNSYTDGSDSSIVLYGLGWFDPTGKTEADTSVYTLDPTQGIQALWIKPWGSNNNYTIDYEDYFAIQSINFLVSEAYAFDDYDQNTMDGPVHLTKTNCNGECMIEIPKMGYRINRVGDTVHVSVTRDDEAEGYSYEAFSRDGGYTTQDYLYIGAYPNASGAGSLSENWSPWGSFSGQDPITYDTSELRHYMYIKNNFLDKPGYSFFTYYAYVLIACLNVLYNKHVKTDRLDDSDAPSQRNGVFNKKGMMYSNNAIYKFIGIERINGISGSSLIDGIYPVVNYPANNYDIYASNNNIRDTSENPKLIGELLHDTEDSYTVASGDCGAEGSNVRWTLYKDGTFVVSGNGAMQDYEPWEVGQESAPSYNSFVDDIKSLVIESGVTSIGAYAFTWTYNAKNVSIPETVTTIGDCAFFHSGFQYVYLPNSDTTYSTNAFYLWNDVTPMIFNSTTANAGNTFYQRYIEYNSNGMDVEVPPRQYTPHPELYGQSETSICINSITPVHNNYIFKGWALTPDGEVRYNPGDIQMPGCDDNSYTYTDTILTLYAVWEEDTTLQDTVKSGYVTSITGNNEMSFIPRKVGGSSQSYYCNHFNFDGNSSYFTISCSANSICGLTADLSDRLITRVMYLEEGE